MLSIEKKCFSLFPDVEKSLIMSTPKRDLLVCLYEYFTKFIPSKRLKFFPVSFFIVLLTKSSK